LFLYIQFNKLQVIYEFFQIIPKENSRIYIEASS
jgi:hypothetical protein